MRPFDVLIASAGGHPIDIDLRQTHKGLKNACYALRPGGTILFFADCQKGAGIRAFEEFVNRYDDEFQMEDALKREFVVGGHKAYWVVRLGRRYDVHLVSSLDSGFVERCHYRPVRPEDAQDELDSILRECGLAARIGVIPHAGFVLPSQIPMKEAVI